MAGRKPAVRQTVFDPTRLRVLLPVIGVAWVLGKLIGSTSEAIDTIVIVVIFYLTWDWVRTIAGRVESLEAELDDHLEKQRIENLAVVGRDPEGRFARRDDAE